MAGDAWFCAIGLVVGIGLGLVGWRMLRDLGWPLVLLVAAVAVLAALVCWLVGHQLGPEDFVQRLAAGPARRRGADRAHAAGPGSLLTWPFLAIVPVLLGSSLGPDDEEPKPLFKRRERAESVLREPENG